MHDAIHVPAVIFADEALIRAMDQKVYEQAVNVASLPGILKDAYAMPDAHLDYGFPIGGVTVYTRSTNIRVINRRTSLLRPLPACASPRSTTLTPDPQPVLDRSPHIRRCSVTAVNGCLFERTRPEVLDLAFGCDPVLEFVARLETASFGEVVRCFSGHCVQQIRPAPDGGSLLDGP
jgi:tRNA-splicing ligase RtcB